MALINRVRQLLKQGDNAHPAPTHDPTIYDIQGTLGLGPTARNRGIGADGPATTREQPATTREHPTTTREQRKDFDALSNVANKRPPLFQPPSERDRRPSVYDGNDPAYLPDENVPRVPRPTTPREQRKDFDALSNVAIKRPPPFQPPSERERRATVYDGNSPDYLPEANVKAREQLAANPAANRLRGSSGSNILAQNVDAAKLNAPSGSPQLSEPERNLNRSH